MSIKLKVGDKVELNNGEVHEVTDMFGDDPLGVNDHGFGPFLINGLRYHQDGRFAYTGFGYDLSVGSVIPDADTPTLWRDMTDAEKVALLLAHHEGKVIEWMAYDGSWQETDCEPSEWHNDAYRIKPEPKRETVTLYCDGGNSGKDPITIGTIDLIDGEPDPTSIKMEKL